MIWTTVYNIWSIQNMAKDTWTGKSFVLSVWEIIHYNTFLNGYICAALAYLNGFISIFGSILVIFEARMREGSIMLLAAVFLQFWIFDLINDPFVLPK